MPPIIFHNRADAGRHLARRLKTYAHHPGTLILGLPRGGVAVAAEIAKILKAPLDVFTVRKIGVPGNAELAIGAVASGGVRVINQSVVEEAGMPKEELDAAVEQKIGELADRDKTYRGDAPPLDATGRTVILVDDGMATGATMLAAVRALRQQNPARLVVAVPLAPLTVCHRLRPEADEIICLYTAENFVSVSSYYKDFSQTTDEDVQELLKKSSRD